MLKWIGLCVTVGIALAACGAASTDTVSPTALPTVRVVSVPATAGPPSTTPTTAPSATPPLLSPTPQRPPPLPEVWPTPDSQTATRYARVPILMYHYIEPWPTDADELRQGLTVQPEAFTAQMQYLREHGYTSISLYDLTKALALGAPLPEKPVILTFDDGYRTLLDTAIPLAEQNGFKGTVFVITQFMDERRPLYLTWEQAETLHTNGWGIEPHTKTHDSLAGRDRDFQVYQILGSIQTVAAHIGRYPRFLAYPIGKYDDLSVQVAGELGLWGAVTTEFGRTHTLADQFTWSRVRVDGRGTLQDFVNALGGE